MTKNLEISFKKIYGSFPEVFASAPGRINIIGEHTDYNQGYVLPAAINLRNYFLISSRTDKRVNVWTENFRESAEFSLRDLTVPGDQNWVNYVKGIFWALEKEGYSLQGIDGFIKGDIPLEAGLSSSAALEVSIISGLNVLFRLDLSPEKMAKIAQNAENDFVGVKCGLMDQSISVFGQKKKALFLDCELLSYEHIPLRLYRENLGFLVFYSGVRRDLASSEYNRRRTESASAFEVFKKIGLRTYKEATLPVLQDKRVEMDEVLFKRARHVISENNRVMKAVKALKEDDFVLLGKLLFQSHESLRDDYEVSCPELDLLYKIGKTFSGCLGARLIGAGFGGSGIVLVKRERMDDFRKKIIDEADKRGFPKPEFYEIEIGDGAKAYKLD